MSIIVMRIANERDLLEDTAGVREYKAPTAVRRDVTTLSTTNQAGASIAQVFEEVSKFEKQTVHPDVCVGTDDASASQAFSRSRGSVTSKSRPYFLLLVAHKRRAPDTGIAKSSRLERKSRRNGHRRRM